VQEFSLEKIAEKIHFSKTKSYFKEVLSSYNNENYRSAVVMLWSVAICDLVYKLENLIEVYDDGEAKKILTDIAKLQQDEARNSNWEIKLIDSVYEKTNLLDNAEYENLRYLQKQRHLSAHPVLNAERELHSPNKETVRSLLRNTLEGLLTKPPFYSQKIMNELLVDLAEASPALTSKSKIKQYVEARYLSRTTPPVELSLLRSFWKLVFKTINDECNKNRPVNLHVLETLVNRNLDALKEAMVSDKDYFSNIATTGTAAIALIYFLSRNESLYPLFTDDARLKIDHMIKDKHEGKLMGWFLAPSLMAHADNVEQWISSSDRPSIDQNQFDAFLQISDSEEWESRVCKILSLYYSVSRSYDEADKRFQTAIPKYLQHFNEETLSFLIEKSENNNQCYSRGRAYIDNELIKNKLDELSKGTFDFGQYPNFQKTIS
jgi:hypothetical protein